MRAGFNALVVKKRRKSKDRYV